jgi:aminomethyltransferase
MVPFGGWEMPLSYRDGTVAEHLACRQEAVMFDVSHLGTVRVDGPGAYDQLQAVLSNDLGRIAPGRAQYTHLLGEDGSVLDDIIVWWVGERRFDVMPNASNTARVLAALGGRDVTGERAVVAVQGPAARSRLARVFPEAAAVPRFRVARLVWAPPGGASVEVVVAGTGYTGEDGVECAVPAPAASAFWQALLDVGVRPAGLGARDTLRLEAGLPLHGHELGPGITPLEAGLGWVVAWDKAGGFVGREALQAQRAAGVSRRLGGVVTQTRQPPRQDYAVRVGEDAVGLVTSGNFSPVMERGIGLAFLPPDLAPGTPVSVQGRGRALDAVVATLPFVAKKKE